MPVIRSTDTVVHEVHGSTFRSFVAPSRGSDQLCAWRLTVPGGLQGVAHRPTREEVLLLLEGELRITLEGAPTDLQPGDVALVPAGTSFVWTAERPAPLPGSQRPEGSRPLWPTAPAWRRPGRTDDR